MTHVRTLNSEPPVSWVSLATLYASQPGFLGARVAAAQASAWGLSDQRGAQLRLCLNPVTAAECAWLERTFGVPEGVLGRTLKPELPTP